MNHRRHFLFAHALSILIACSVHAQDPIWLSHYGNASFLYPNGGCELAMDQNGDLYAAGTVSQPGLTMDGHAINVPFRENILVAKLNGLGITQWASAPGGSCIGEAEGATILQFDRSEQQLIVSGFSAGTAVFDSHTLAGGCGVGEADMFVAAYDPAGSCQWVQGARGYPNYSSAVLLSPTSDVHVFGRSEVANTFLTSPAVNLAPGAYRVIYSSAGELISSERTMPNGYIADAQWQSDDLVLCGQFRGQDSLWGTPLVGTSPWWDGFVARADENGNVQWITTVRGDTAVSISKEVLTPGGKVIVLGLTQGNAYFATDTLELSSPEFTSGFLACFDPNGVLLWDVPIRSEPTLRLLNLAIGPNGQVYLHGQFKEQLHIGEAMVQARTSMDHFIARFDTLGYLLGELHVGRAQPTSSGSLLVNDNGIFFSGPYDSTMTWQNLTVPVSQLGSTDLFIAKLDDASFNSIGEQRSSGSTALHIYANPNNGLCTIDLPSDLRATNDLVLSVFDNTGQLVQRVPLIFSNNGVRLDIRAQAKGIYHVELGDGIQRYTGTIVFE